MLVKTRTGRKLSLRDHPRGARARPQRAGSQALRQGSRRCASGCTRGPALGRCVKKLLELLVCFLHPLAVVLAWINLAGRSDLSGGQKLAWAHLRDLPDRAIRLRPHRRQPLVRSEPGAWCYMPLASSSPYLSNSPGTLRLPKRSCSSLKFSPSLSLSSGCSSRHGPAPTIVGFGRRDASSRDGRSTFTDLALACFGITPE